VNDNANPGQLMQAELRVVKKNGTRKEVEFYDFIDSKDNHRRMYKSEYIRLRARQMEDGKPIEHINEFRKVFGYGVRKN